MPTRGGDAGEHAGMHPPFDRCVGATPDGGGLAGGQQALTIVRGHPWSLSADPDTRHLSAAGPRPVPSGGRSLAGAAPPNVLSRCGSRLLDINWKGAAVNDRPLEVAVWCDAPSHPLKRTRVFVNVFTR